MDAVDLNALTRDNRQICIQMEQLANRSMLQVGLTAIQASILLYILDHSDRGTSLTAIHREFGYSMAALCGLIKRLREKGYVRVEQYDGDNRCKLLLSTEKALQIKDFLDQSIQQVQHQLYDRFTQSELIALHKLQKKMMRNLSQYPETGLKEVFPL